MRRIIRFLAVILMIPVAVLITSPARAADVAVLTAGSLGGENIPVDAIINGSLKAGTVKRWVTSPGGNTGIFCPSATFAATVVTNPPAGGVATLSWTTVRIGNCTSNVSGLTLQSIGLNLPLGVTIDGASKRVAIVGGATPIQLKFAFSTILGTVSCVYVPPNNSVSGVISNADNSATFIDQQNNKVSGPGLCPSSLFYSATFILSTGGQPVFVQ